MFQEKMKMQFRLAMVLLTTVLTAVSSFAQGRIDKVLDDLEKKPDVETTYTERRTAKGRKLYRVTTILTFSKPDYYKRLSKAFEDERGNAVSAVKSRTQLTYRFQNDKGTSSYTVTKSNNEWTVVKSWRSTDDRGDDTGELDMNFDGNVRGCTTSTGTVTTIVRDGSVVKTIVTTIEDNPEQACSTDGMARQQARQARQQAREARQQAREARRQAREARKQARLAREQAREVREQARQARRQAREQARNEARNNANVTTNYYSL